MKELKIIFKCGKYLIFSQDGKQGVAKKRFLFPLEILLPAKVNKVEQAFMFGKGIFKITNGTRYGLYDVENKCSFLPVVYKDIVYGWKNRVVVCDNADKYFVVNYKNEEIIGASDFISTIFYNGNYCFYVLRKGKYGILDVNGAVILPFIYDFMSVVLFKYWIYRINGENILYNLHENKKICSAGKSEIFFNDYYFYYNFAQKRNIIFEDADEKQKNYYHECLKEAVRNVCFL